MNKNLMIGILVLVVVLFIGGSIYIFGNNSQNPNHQESNNKLSRMNPNDFNNAIETGDYELIDVRTTQEFEEGYIKGATQNDFYKTQEFSNYLDSLDKDKKYLIYCRSGSRSGQTLKIMQEKGFTNVSDLDGGYNAWTSSGLPIEK